MRSRIDFLANLIGFHISWFACILGAAAGYPWLGVISVAVLGTLHVWTRKTKRSREVALMAIAAVVGFAADSTLVLTGLLDFPESAQIGAPTTWWMVAMWINFAGTLTVSMRWLRGRLVIATLFGAIGGPLAYFTGARLGAVIFPDGTAAGLVAVAVEWGVALPILVLLATPRAERAPRELEVVTS